MTVGTRGATVLLSCLLAALAGCQGSSGPRAGAPPPSSPGVTVLRAPDPTAPPVASPAAAMTTTVEGGFVLPDRTATPGAVDPAATVELVCAEGYSKSVHAARYTDKQAAYALYGVSETGRLDYRIDHLVPVSLGGSNDVANLWPQPTAEGAGAEDKDRLEARLRQLVCTAALPLATAQAAMTTDWTAAYTSYLPGPVPVASG